MYEKDAFNINAWHFDFRHLLNTFSYLCGLLFKSCSPTFLHLLGIKYWKNSVSGKRTESWRCCAYKITVLYFSPSVSQRIKPHYKWIKPSAQQIRANIFLQRKKEKEEVFEMSWGLKVISRASLKPPWIFLPPIFSFFFGGKMQVIPFSPQQHGFSGLSAHARNVYCNLLRLAVTPVSEPF